MIFTQTSKKIVYYCLTIVVSSVWYYSSFGISMVKICYFIIFTCWIVFDWWHFEIFVNTQSLFYFLLESFLIYHLELNSFWKRKNCFLSLVIFVWVGWSHEMKAFQLIFECIFKCCFNLLRYYWLHFSSYLTVNLYHFSNHNFLFEV